MGLAGMSTEGRINQMLIPSDLLAARVPEQEILEALGYFGYPEQAVFAVKLSFEEALINAVKHGNRGDPAKYITVRYDVNATRAVIIVADEGRGFCPASIPDCTAEENLTRPSGRGIMLMRAYMDQVQYSRRGNMVRMVKRNRTQP
jgi:serine/threonine-protein kinase RsbW